MSRLVFPGVQKQIDDEGEIETTTKCQQSPVLVKKKDQRKSKKMKIEKNVKVLRI